MMLPEDVERDLVREALQNFDGWMGDDMHDDLWCVFGCPAHPKQGTVGIQHHDDACVWKRLSNIEARKTEE